MEVLGLIIRYLKLIESCISYVFLGITTLYLIYSGIHDKIKHVDNEDDYTIRR